MTRRANLLSINELYRRAKEDPSIKLNIFTHSPLKCRISVNWSRGLGTLVERIFGGSPVCEYMVDIRDGRLLLQLFEFITKPAQ